MITRPLALAATALLLAGCGAQLEQPTSASTSASPIRVTNCSAPLEVSGTPSRVVANDTGIVEMLFALGLRERLVGYTTSGGADRDIASSPWRRDFETSPFLGEAFTREVIQKADPDFVFAGWNYGFRESTGVTPDWISSIGATAYQLTEACRQPGTTKRGIMPPLDALYADLANLGDLFGVRDRAEELIADYRAEVARASTQAPPGDRRARVFLFDSAAPSPFTSGKNAAPQQIITEAGGSNVFADLDDSWTTVSWEAAAQRDPQMIVIVDYGVGPANTVAAKITQLRTHPLMANTEAVRDNQIISFPYAAMVEGPRNPATITELAKFLRSAGF